MRLLVTRFRCPRCRKTATALPGDVLPGVGQDLGTVAGIVAAYLGGGHSYRELTLRVLGLEAPAGTTANTAWASPVAPSPTPSTCFRWLARFLSGARAWWGFAAAQLQAREAYVPAAAPAFPAALARSEGKRAGLRLAWQALDALRRLTGALGLPPERWPFVMRHAPSSPRGLDRTGWFGKPPPPP